MKINFFKSLFLFLAALFLLRHLLTNAQNSNGKTTVTLKPPYDQRFNINGTYNLDGVLLGFLSSMFYYTVNSEPATDAFYTTHPLGRYCNYGDDTTGKYALGLTSKDTGSAKGNYSSSLFQLSRGTGSSPQWTYSSDNDRYVCNPQNAFKASWCSFTRLNRP